MFKSGSMCSTSVTHLTLIDTREPRTAYTLIRKITARNVHSSYPMFVIVRQTEDHSSVLHFTEQELRALIVDLGCAPDDVNGVIRPYLQLAADE